MKDPSLLTFRRLTVCSTCPALSANFGSVGFSDALASVLKPPAHICFQLRHCDFCSFAINFI